LKLKNNLPQYESKTKRKNLMISLQKIGETLVNLPAAQLAQVPLDPVLFEAIETARSLTTREAKRRQLQYIGKLMRTIDPEPIQATLDKFQNKNKQANAQFHQIEQWRAKLIGEDNKDLEIFITKFPRVDHVHLRQLIRHAKQEKLGAQTRLFRYLREIIENHE
jgi:ribosome-associated protein